MQQQPLGAAPRPALPRGTRELGGDQLRRHHAFQLVRPGGGGVSKPGDANRRPGVGDVFEYISDDHFRERYGGAYQDARDKNEPLAGILTPLDAEAVRLVVEDPKRPRVLLSDALALYLRSHHRGSQTKFARDSTRAIENVTLTASNSRPSQPLARALTATFATS